MTLFQMFQAEFQLTFYLGDHCDGLEFLARKGDGEEWHC